jgi:hypothetical protein
MFCLSKYSIERGREQGTGSTAATSTVMVDEQGRLTEGSHLEEGMVLVRKKTNVAE